MMSETRKRLLIFIAFLLVIAIIAFLLGYKASEAHMQKEIIEIETSLDALKCERDSLVEAYALDKLVLAKQVDSLRVVNKSRKKLIEEYRRKMSTSLPANAKELEGQIYGLLNLIRSEILPDEERVPRK